jgi:tRNA (guanine10-N2)-dimethyltransferase
VYCLELAGEDDAFAAAEARAAAPDASVVAPGLALAPALDAERARRLAYTHRASEVVGRTDADPESARALLDAAALDCEGSVAVRARDVRASAGVDTQAVERALGGVLVDRGLTVDLDDPDHELRALFGDDACVVGWLAVETERGYGDRKPTDRPFFQPGSMDPLLARALVNLAGARPGVVLLDPMCGTGGVLMEAGFVGATPVGVDAQAKMVRGARENLRAFLGDGFHLARADATCLPLRAGSVDAVVFDAPYGRQSRIEGESVASLVGGALREARRVVREGGRGVVVGDRSWADAARDAGWTVESEFERRVHRSLTRHVVVVA